jgi:hypothetical protein
MHFFVLFVKTKIPQLWRANSSGWMSGNCPVCTMNGQPRPDRKNRGGFHLEENAWVYHCFNCGFKTGWRQHERISNRAKKLLKAFGADEAELQRMGIALLREEEHSQLLRPQPAPVELFRPKWPEVDLPAKTMSIVDFQDPLPENLCAGLAMLDSRKLLHWYDWAYSQGDIKYRKRIILPYKHNGKIVGYNARFIGTPSAQIPKYLVTKPPHYVFNLDRQTEHRKVVIVTEGDFDAITVDGVSVGSNSVSNDQAKLINQLNRQVILLPDFDRAGEELLEPAIANGWSVSFPEWMAECKDANAASQKYGRAFVVKSTMESATDNPTKIRIMAGRLRRAEKIRNEHDGRI